MAEVEGKQLKIKTDFEFLPTEGERLEIYVEVPGVGAAVVATAQVTGIEGDFVLARVTKSTGKVQPGQKVRSLEGESTAEPSAATPATAASPAPTPEGPPEPAPPE